MKKKNIIKTSMTLCLSTTIIKPEKDIPINNAIILLHGYGGDGKDISMLTLNWKRFLPNAIFLCPNGHEKCEINPGGYQWFDLTKDDPEYILEQSKKAETKLHEFIEEIKEKYNLENSQICLSGFSQGCMMSINLGLTSNENYNCVVGFSGKIINQDDLKKRKKSFLVSPLDEIPGIGRNRKKTLLNHFGSAKTIEGASLEDLKKVDGISELIAKKIYNYFHLNKNFL